MTDNPAIRAADVSKWYRLGERVSHRMLRESISGTFGYLFQGRDAKRAPEIWAVKDVSFEIESGEVFGIIGRNGAGKSTLLKILARITEPTEGRVEIRGRVGSLLEVGTGFHPELTGRENVYLNGAILGMKRSEIDRKFDDIIGFAEVESFVDTPVKRYSSGMQMRLAFAVAAHLEPEILLVDEVLAVGDSAFQNRCLGRMGEVASEGRTVVFVSHNMAAVAALCDSALLLDQGRMIANGAVGETVSRYVDEYLSVDKISIDSRTDREGNGRLRFDYLEVSQQRGADSAPMSGKPIMIRVGFTTSDGKPMRNVRVAITFLDMYGRVLFLCDTRLVNAGIEVVPGQGEFICELKSLQLATGSYSLNVWATVSEEVADYVQHACNFSVEEGDFFGTGRFTVPSKNGPFLVHHDWSVIERH